MIKLIRGTAALLAAFLLGASLIDVASGHRGSPEFLHSQHGDTMQGELRAKGFLLSQPRVSYVAIAPASIHPLDEASPSCAGFRRERAFVSAPPDCEMVAQVTPANHATIERVTWDLQPDGPTDVTLELVSYNDLGNTPRTLASDTRLIDPCDPGCKLGFSAFPIPGVNPVIPQRRTYSLFFSSDDQPIQTTRIMVTTTVKRPGPF